MKFNNLLSFCLVFVLLTSSTFLTAQTYQQQQVSTRILTKMFDGKLKFNPKKTRRISSKQLQKIINSNTVLTSDLKKEVASQLIPRSASGLLGWHAIVAEFTAECGEIITLVTLWTEQTHEIHILFPPGNKCGSILASLYPGIYKDEYDWENMNTFTAKRCLSLWDDDSICANLIVFSPFDNPNFLNDQDCETNSDCSKEEVEVLDYLVDLFMVKKK